MKKLISFIAGLLTLLGGFHFYLNIISADEVSFETTLNILRTNFKNYPIKTSALILFILLLSLIVTYSLDKLFSYIAYRERRREQDIKNSLKNINKKQENRDLIFDKIVNTKVSILKTGEKPWNRINLEFQEIIVRDITDNSFPELGNWFKCETFNLTKDGIEFFDPSNVSGFDLYLNKNYCWDVFHNEEKINSKKYTKLEKAYCIDFLPYENILNVDWEHDDYYANITVFCQFKYKTNNIRHPFKEFRYYISGNGFLTLLDESKRRNFRPVILQIINKVTKPIRRFRIYWKN